MQVGKYKVKTSWVVLGVVTVAAVWTVVGLFSTFNNIQKQSVDRETFLSQQYLNNQNQLSTYIVKVKEQLQIADRKTDKLDQVLSDAIRGRYEGDTTAQPQGGQMFSAIVEAYPQLDLSVYDKVQDSISAGREAFKNKQSQLLDRLREYDRWRQSGLIHSRLVSLAGIPSNRLIARVGDQQFKGDEALEQMYKLVLAKESTEAFKTGTMTSLDLNPTTTTGK